LLRHLLLAAFLIALPSTALAQLTVEPMQPNAQGDYLPDPSMEAPLNSDELTAAFSGMTHRGTYNFRRPNIDTFAFEETTSADGTTRHAHGDKVDTGTWRIMANVICFQYNDWEGEGGIHRACFNIYQRGNCFYHYGLQSGFGGSFTARSVHAGETPECEPPMS
jgi:hypothetical protein